MSTKGKPVRTVNVTPSRERIRSIQQVTFEYFQGKFGDDEALKRIKSLVG